MIMPSDLMSVEYDFGSIIRHLEVEPFLTQLPKDALLSYKDGSKSEQRSAVGTYGPARSPHLQGTPPRSYMQKFLI